MTTTRLLRDKGRMKLYKYSRAKLRCYCDFTAIFLLFGYKVVIILSDGSKSIPVNEEYYELKNGTKPKKKVWIESETKDFKQKIIDSGYSKNIKQNILKLYEEIGTEIFGNSRVVEVLGCSEVTATSYLKRMERELKIIVPVVGMGKGKYKFSS